MNATALYQSESVEPPISQLLLCAHGVRDSERAKQRLAELTETLLEQLAPMGIDVQWEAGAPKWTEAVDRLGLRTGVVVPLLFSSGYFYQYRLKPLLKDKANLYLAKPLGLAESTLGYVAERARQLMAQSNLNPTGTEVIIVGHGSRTRALYKSGLQRVISHLKADGLNARAAFLEGYPSLSTALRSANDAILIPYLMGDGWHASEDLPQQIEAAHSPDQGTLIVDEPLGLHDNVASLILNAAGLQGTQGWLS